MLIYMWLISIFASLLPILTVAYQLIEGNRLITNRTSVLRDDNPMYNLTLHITNESYNQLDIRIEDENKQQFRIPEDIEPFKTIYNDVKNPLNYSHYDYTVTTQANPFTLRVARTDTQETIFHLHNLTVSKLYNEYTLTIPSKLFFGLGERNAKGFRFREGTYTLWAKDVPELLEDGRPPGKGVYSSQPVYLMREKSGKYHVFFFKNSSPIDVIYKDDALTFKYIGGILQIKLFLGDYDPESAIKLYHSYFRGWALHPFWAMGYHHSRWPIKNSARLKELVRKHKENDLPLDTIWSDIDYMFDRQIFSVDETRFKQEDYDEIQNPLKVNYIPIIDVAVGVKYGKQDKGFREGINLDVFLRSPRTGARLKGRVWPGSAYYPDFFHPNCSTYWRTMIKELQQKTNFSGLWIDMNEPTNFCKGECEEHNWNRTLDYEDRKEEFKNDIIIFPYIPGTSRLEEMTLPPHTLHYGGYLHKDVHNLYGMMETYETYNAQKDLGKELPFIISRASFPGAGHFTQIWLGDNAATFDFMYISIGQVFQFGIFGIPMTGADVCGFLQNTTQKLCSRWVQLGALYPFFRNHNNDQAIDQEFYVLGDDVLHAAQKNIHLRYSILKWYYTQFLLANHTGMVFKPLFFEFLGDIETLKDHVLDTQIMLGSELMATPILQPSTTIRKAYFPSSNWYHFLSGQLLHKATEPGGEHLISCEYDSHVPLFIRGGKIVMRQNTTNVLTHHDLTSHFYAVIAIEDYDSIGYLLDVPDYSDKTIKENCDQNNCILNVTLSIRSEQAIFRIVRADDGRPPRNSIFVDRLRLYGFPKMGQIKCQSQLSIQCESMSLKPYVQNSLILINEGVGIEFGEKTGVFQIEMLF